MGTTCGLEPPKFASCAYKQELSGRSITPRVRVRFLQTDATDMGEVPRQSIQSIMYVEKNCPAAFGTKGVPAYLPSLAYSHLPRYPLNFRLQAGETASMTDTPEPKREKRHIVICGGDNRNEISENISNVLKLYRPLRETEKTHPNQMVLCDPGVGTPARTGLAFVPGWSERTALRADPLAPSRLQTRATTDVRDYGSLRSRLCENSDAQLACRISVSISSMQKPNALAASVGRRQLRKQFCASFVQARFHTAWFAGTTLRDLCLTPAASAPPSASQTPAGRS